MHCRCPTVLPPDRWVVIHHTVYSSIYLYVFDGLEGTLAFLQRQFQELMEDKVGMCSKGITEHVFLEVHGMHFVDSTAPWPPSEPAP